MSEAIFVFASCIDTITPDAIPLLESKNMRRSENVDVRITFCVLAAVANPCSFSKKTAMGNYFQLRRRIASCREGGKSLFRREGAAVHPLNPALVFCLIRLVAF
jgi:hypothetical protein